MWKQKKKNEVMDGIIFISWEQVFKQKSSPFYPQNTILISINI